jgi:hypothetical protein
MCSHRMTDIMTSWNIDLPSWDTLHSVVYKKEILRRSFSEILGFRTLSIVLVIKNTVKNSKKDVSATGSVFLLFFTVFLITRTMDRVRKPNISESDTEYAI